MTVALVPRRCPTCRGAGTVRNGAGVPFPCPRCAGEGDYTPLRPYQAGRRCGRCARPFQPGLDARGDALRLCTWCLRRAPAPATCRTCGQSIAWSGRGRPPTHCPAHPRTGRRRSHATILGQV